MRPWTIKLMRTALERRGDVTDIAIYPSDYYPNQKDFQFIGGPDYFADDCVFDTLPDKDARRLLSAWIDDQCDPDGPRPICLEWGVHQQLSRLLSRRGQLVGKRVEPILRRLADGNEGTGKWLQQGMLASYLPLMKDGEALAVGMIETSHYDCRDALFLACRDMNTPAIYDTLRNTARKWIRDPYWTSASGEIGGMLKILDRWDATFPKEGHAELRWFYQSYCDTDDTAALFEQLPPL